MLWVLDRELLPCLFSDSRVESSCSEFFCAQVNERFKHGVPKATNTNCGPRFSIIAW